MSDLTSKSSATQKAIKQAFVRIKKNRPKVVDKGRKMSIAAVAEESGFSRATIHKYHPDIAELIRSETGKDVRAQRNQKHEELKTQRDKNRALRKELRGAKEQVRQLASINATLTMENNRLSALLSSDNVTVLSPKK